MKLRSKGRRTKGVEATIFNPHEESLIDKALYASLQTNKKSRPSGFVNDSNNSSLSETKTLPVKMVYAARKTATVIAGGLLGRITNDSSFEPDEDKPNPPSTSSSTGRKRKEQYVSTENFITFLALRDTPYLPDELRYIEDIPWEPVAQRKKPSTSKPKSKAGRPKNQKPVQKSVIKAKKSLLVSNKKAAAVKKNLAKLTKQQQHGKKLLKTNGKDRKQTKKSLVERKRR